MPAVGMIRKWAGSICGVRTHEDEVHNLEEPGWDVAPDDSPAVVFVLQIEQSAPPGVVRQSSGIFVSPPAYTPIYRLRA